MYEGRQQLYQLDAAGECNYAANRRAKHLWDCR